MQGDEHHRVGRVADKIIDLNPAKHITVDVIDGPEERTFVLQGQSGDALVSLIIDGEQAAALSVAGSELLDILEEHYSREINRLGIPQEESMRLRLPADPLFEVAEFQLGYDEQQDRVVIITIELPLRGHPDGSELGIVRFWISREQVIALVRKIDQLFEPALPICLACGQPIAPSGHHCLRDN